MVNRKSELGDWRMQRAIDALEGRKCTFFHDLPRGVGLKTMEALVRAGLVEEVSSDVGHYAKARAGRLTGLSSS